MRMQYAKSPMRSGSKTDYSPEPHRDTVAVAAYYRAERRGFRIVGELGDWLEAEADIEGLLKSWCENGPKVD